MVKDEELQKAEAEKLGLLKSDNTLEAMNSEDEPDTPKTEDS